MFCHIDLNLSDSALGNITFLPQHLIEVIDRGIGSWLIRDRSDQPDDLVQLSDIVSVLINIALYHRVSLWLLYRLVGLLHTSSLIRVVLLLATHHIALWDSLSWHSASLLIHTSHELTRLGSTYIWILVTSKVWRELAIWLPKLSSWLLRIGEEILRLISWVAKILVYSKDKKFI